MADKVIALRTVMLNYRAYLAGSELPKMEKAKLERLVDAGSVEIVKTRAKRTPRKKKAVKTPPPEESPVNDTPLSDTRLHDSTQIDQEEGVRKEIAEVVEEDTISLDQLDF